MTEEISNRNNTKKIIEKYNFRLKKGFGQNFLVEPNILNKIISKSNIDENTGVIEIGPGIGALTQKIAEKAKKVVAIEVDNSLIPILEESLVGYSNIKIINSDILRLNLNDLINEEFNNYTDVKIVANLPYYITTPIITKILEEKVRINTITILVQKEVAERLVAKPGNKSYASITLLIEYFTNARILFNVPKTVFIPQPKVDSSVLQLDIKDKLNYETVDEEFLFKVIRKSFAQRRKTIYNNLLNNLFDSSKKDELKEILQLSNVDLMRRSETLTLDEFVKLSKNLRNIYKYL